MQEDIKKLVYREPSYETVVMPRSFIQPFKLKVTEIEKVETSQFRAPTMPEGNQLLIPGISQAFIAPS